MNPEGRGPPSSPPDPTYVSGPQISAASSTGNAHPVDSGVDQAPLSVQVLSENEDGSTGPPLPPTDSSYQRIYYRADNTNALITNLLLTGANLNSFLGVSPYAGAYPNNGSVTSSGPGTFDGFHYLSTTSTTSQSVTGHIAGATSPSQPITVLASQISVEGTPGSSAASGISLTCVAQSTGAATPCPLYPISPTQPGLIPGHQKRRATRPPHRRTGNNQPGRSASTANRRNGRSPAGLSTTDRVDHRSDPDRHLRVPTHRPRQHLHPRRARSRG